MINQLWFGNKKVLLLLLFWFFFFRYEFSFSPSSLFFLRSRFSQAKGLPLFFAGEARP